TQRASRRPLSYSKAGAGGAPPRAAAAVITPLGPRVRQLPLNGNLLVRPVGGGGGHVFRIEMSNPLAPHSDERVRRQFINRFPRVFYGRQGISPDRALAPFFALLLAFAGGTHGFPGDAIRLLDVLGGAFPALLMDQVKVAQGRLLVRHPLEQNAFRNDLVGGRDGIVAG